jgi:hypothetical protein
MKPSRLHVVRVLGAALAVLGGAAAVLSLWYVAGLPQRTSLLDEVLAALVVAVVSGWVLHTWWAVLAIPLLFWVGLVATFELVAATLGGRDTASSLWVSFVISFSIYLYVFAPLVLGAILGTNLAKWLAQRAQERQQAV